MTSRAKAYELIGSCQENSPLERAKKGGRKRSGRFFTYLEGEKEGIGRVHWRV